MYKYGWKWLQSKKQRSLRAWLRKYGYYALFACLAFVMCYELDLYAGLNGGQFGAINSQAIDMYCVSGQGFSVGGVYQLGSEVVRCIGLF